jgi:non-specific serine/threonine protein kinase/serine/threonine-protein kinase
VSGELDWIVMKCLEKDRTRRHETANALAQDIQRYFADEPVEACPPSTGYRLMKLARKYRGPLSAAAIFGAVLVAGAVVSTWLAVRATRAETEARAAQDVAMKERDRARTEQENTGAALDFLWRNMLSQFSPWQTPGLDVKLRPLLDRAALQLESERPKSRLVHASIESMLGQLYTELGDFGTARRHLEQARDVQLHELGESDPRTLTTAHNLGRLLLWSYRFNEAVALLDRTLELRRSALGEGHRDTLETMWLAGGAYSGLGRHELGQQLLWVAIEGFTGVCPDERQKQGAQGYLGMALAAQGRFDAATAWLTDCVEQSRRSVNRTPDSYRLLRALAAVYNLRNEPLLAEPLAEEYVKDCRVSMGYSHRWTLDGIRVLARTYHLEGKYDHAGPLLEEAVTAYRAMSAETPEPRLTFVLGMLGENRLAQKNYTEAEKCLRECVGRSEVGPPVADFFIGESCEETARELAFARCLLGASLMGEKKYSEAEPLLLEGYGALTRTRQLNEPKPSALAMQHRLRALGLLVQFYDETGKVDERYKWRKELEAAKADSKMR